MFLSLIKQRKGIVMAVTGLMTLAMTSCDSSFVYEDLRPCVPEYRIRLSYDYNMSSTQKVEMVEAAEAYAFDKDGKLAAVSVADKQKLIDNDWTMPIDLQRFENYDLVVWAGLVSESPFKLDGTRAVNTKEDLTCRLNTEKDSDGRDVSSKSFPHLFHSAGQVSYSVEDGPEEKTVNLVKNNNVIDVLIRSERDEDLIASDYTVEIIDKNGVMGHDNAVSGDQVVYLPSNWISGEYPFADGEGGYLNEGSKAVVAEMHVARLMEGADATLKIYRKTDNKKMYDGNLIELFLKTKNRVAPNMGLQEYLDRQDYFRVDLVLTTKVSIYVNGWRVIDNVMDWTVEY